MPLRGPVNHSFISRPAPRAERITAPAAHSPPANQGSPGPTRLNSSTVLQPAGAARSSAPPCLHYLTSRLAATGLARAAGPLCAATSTAPLKAGRQTHAARRWTWVAVQEHMNRNPWALNPVPLQKQARSHSALCAMRASVRAPLFFSKSNWKG
jgi:hypothetical protein